MAEEVVRIRFETTGADRATRGIRGIGREAKSSATGTDLLRRAMIGLSGAFAVRELVRAADTFTEVRNRIRLVTSSTGELNAVYSKLFSIAQGTNQDLNNTATLYQRLTLATKEMGKSQQDAIDITETINNAIKVSGVEAATASAGIRQLAQGMASGVLRGEELNSVMENTPRLAIAIAEGMGVGIGRLRAMGAEGALTAEAVITALESQREKLEREAANMTVTLGMAFNNVQNSFQDFVGSAGEATGITSMLAGAILAVADNFRVMASAIIGIGATLGALYAIPKVLGLIRVAFLALPFGALILAISSLVGWVVHFGTTTQEIAGVSVSGWDKIRVAMGIVADAFKPLMDALGEFGSYMGAVFDHALDLLHSFANRFIALGRGIGAGVAAMLTPGASAVDAFMGEFNATPIKKFQSDFEGAMAGIRAAIKAPIADLEGEFQKRLAALAAQRKADGPVDLTIPLGPKTPVIDPKADKAAAAAEKAARRAAEQAAEQVRDTIKDMTRERNEAQALLATKDMTVLAVDKLAAAREAEYAIQDLSIASMSKETAEIRRLSAEWHAATVGLEEFQALRDEANSIEPTKAFDLAELERWSAGVEQAMKDAKIPVSDYGDHLDKVLKQRTKEIVDYHLDQAKDAASGMRRALEDYAEGARDAGKMMEDATGNALKNMEDALVEFTSTGKLNFKDFANSLIEDISRMIIKMEIMGPLTEMLGLGGVGGAGGGGKSSGGGESSGGALAGLFGGGGGGFDLFGSLAGGLGAMGGASFGGFNADGGPVMPGKVFVVGEKGPELFVPNSAGNIVSNKESFGGQGQQIIVNNTFQITAPNGSIPRETQGQIAAKVGAQVNRAMARDR